MKKLDYYKWIVGVCLILILTACQDWLDVRPKTEIESKDLFESESGFKEALAGVYSNMTSQQLYGRDLTFGIIDALGQCWDIKSTANEFFYFTVYNYQEKVVQVRIDTIWASMYNVIANINNILEHIDAQRGIFYKDNYSIIKGEALALRAYVHFDLLRMFAPADFSGVDKVLPYVKEFSKQVVAYSTPKEFVDLVVADLVAAAQLLKTDPLVTGEEITTDEDKGYLINRQFHMNYYAVQGLLARVQLYAGRNMEARTAAWEVVEAHEQNGLFPWIKRDDITVSEKALRDRTFSSELLFALNIRKLVDYIKPYFRESSGNLATRRDISTMYEGMADYRKDYLFETSGSQADVCAKLWQEEAVNGKTPKRDRMPMIRLSEMYYILAECDKADVGKAVGYLNSVRQNRGIPVDLQEEHLSSDDVQNEILKEYQKEFICEGQLWFYHTRRHDAAIANVKADYVFPVPVAEKDYGNRNQK